MANLGAKGEKASAQRMRWYYGPGTDEYIALFRKSIEYTRRQFDMPTTGLGVVYYSGKLRGKFVVALAYTSGEVGNSVPQNFDEMITESSATGEIPEEAFRFQTVDDNGLAKNWDFNAKMTRLRAYGDMEGPTYYELEFVITDAAPSVS